MEVHYNGFNATRKKIDAFRFNLPARECTLKDLLFTFDQIYLFQKGLLIFDFEKNEFKPLEHQPDGNVISTCSNSTNLWCLSFRASAQTYQIYEYKEGRLMNEIDLPELSDEATSQDLFMLATDVNAYIFSNANNELKCKFDLNSRRETKQKFQKQEKQLNESASSMMPLNKVLIVGRVVQACSGKEHVLLLLDNKRVYSFGIGTKGFKFLGSYKNYNSFYI